MASHLFSGSGEVIKVGIAYTAGLRTLSYEQLIIHFIRVVLVPMQMLW